MFESIRVVDVASCVLILLSLLPLSSWIYIICLVKGGFSVHQWSCSSPCWSVWSVPSGHSTGLCVWDDMLMTMVCGGDKWGVFCVQAEQALLTVLVLLLCAGRFVWAVLEWMRSNATLSSRTTSGPLTTSERVSVCMFLNLVYFCFNPHYTGAASISGNV